MEEPPRDGSPEGGVELRAAESSRGIAYVPGEEKKDEDNDENDDRFTLHRLVQLHDETAEQLQGSARIRTDNHNTDATTCLFHPPLSPSPSHSRSALSQCVRGVSKSVEKR